MKKPSSPRRRPRPIAPTFIEPPKPRRTSPKSRLGWQLSLGIGAFLAVLFIVSIGFRLGFTVRVVVASGICGFCIGAVQAPVFAPERFRYPLLWQGVWGATGGAGLAVALQWSLDSVVVAAGIGAILSFLGIHLLRIIDPLLR